MAYIRSANPDFDLVKGPNQETTGYKHGINANPRRSFIPVAFQITSPFYNTRVLLPHALVMHVNPATFNETHNKRVERIQTRGGFVEQHWGDDLEEISADGSTGAFMNLKTGLSSVLRQKSIAWDRFRDLHDLYRNNGSVYDPSGAIVLQGNVMLMYDRGTYIGYFRTFEYEETQDSPFAFHVSWTFKVEKTLLQISTARGTPVRVPQFQSENKLQGAMVGVDPTAKPVALPAGTTSDGQTAEAYAKTSKPGATSGPKPGVSKGAGGSAPRSPSSGRVGDVGGGVIFPTVETRGMREGTDGFIGPPAPPAIPTQTQAPSTPVMTQEQREQEELLLRENAARAAAGLPPGA